MRLLRRAFGSRNRWRKAEELDRIRGSVVRLRDLGRPGEPGLQWFLRESQGKMTSGEFKNGITGKSSSPISEIDVLWMTAGLGCDGDTIAVTAATQPSIEDF